MIVKVDADHDGMVVGDEAAKSNSDGQEETDADAASDLGMEFTY